MTKKPYESAEQAELIQSLLAQVESMSLALEASHVGTWSWDVASGKILWSTKLEELFGMTPQSFSGTYEDYMKAIHPDDRDNLQSIVQAAIQNKNPYQVEHRVVWPNGTVRWLLGKGQAFFDSSGQLVRMTGTTSDITDRKLAEESLAKRTEELDRFATIAAHDLKAPLNSITQFAELLIEEHQAILDPAAQQYLGFISQAAHKMKKFIDSLLAYARAGELHAKSKDRVHFDSILAEAQKNLLAQLQSSNTKVMIESKLPEVFGSEILLIQLVQNLLSNSIKYRHPEKDPQIQVLAEEKAEVWQISIRDNGLGIEGQQLSQVFDFFHRAHPEKAHEGSGVGLAICKKIVENHGGRIWAESQQGQGSCFSFTLPKADRH